MTIQRLNMLLVGTGPRSEGAFRPLGGFCCIDGPEVLHRCPMAYRRWVEGAVFVSSQSMQSLFRSWSPTHAVTLEARDRLGKDPPRRLADPCRHPQASVNPRRHHQPPPRHSTRSCSTKATCRAASARLYRSRSWSAFSSKVHACCQLSLPPLTRLDDGPESATWEKEWLQSGWV
jgi:hypothetical protein